MPSLTVHTRAGVLATIDLSPHPIILGRADTCDIVLPHDGEVSREHARVWLDETGQVLVQDYRSKNGTRVDGGEPFHSSVRPAQHSIRIGEYEIEISGVRPVNEVPEPPVRFQPDSPVESDNTRFFPSSRQLDLNHQRLGMLMSLTERIGGAFEPKQLLEQALDACCETLGFERGLIALKTPRGEPELPVTRNVQRDETGAFKVSRTLINRALIDGERAVVNNPAVDLVNNLSESLVRFPICSALCVPILHRERILGVIYGDRISQGSAHKPYTPEDVDFLAAIARQVGVGLENLRLFQSFLETETFKAELRKARAIQCGLLPSRPLKTAHVLLAGHNEASETVGGDYFDYFELGADRIGFIIADVTGHGLPAALVMANLQAAVRVGLTVDIALPEVTARLNRLAATNTGPNVFVTAILGRIDAATGAVEYVNAGHPAPLLVRGGAVDVEDDGHSLPLGIEPTETFEVQYIEPGHDLQAVLFYTDGLIEAANPDGDLLSVEAVVSALGQLRGPSADQILHGMLSLVRSHLGAAKIADDLTLLAVQYNR